MSNEVETPSEIQRFQEAYRQMATGDKPHYRPGAPSDGWGNITVPIEELDLETESLRWAVKLSREADEGSSPDYLTNRAFVYATSLVDALCMPELGLARKLVNLLVAEMDDIEKEY